MKIVLLKKPVRKIHNFSMLIQKDDYRSYYDLRYSNILTSEHGGAPMHPGNEILNKRRI